MSKWLVMRDGSGHHRAVQPLSDASRARKGLLGDAVVDEADGYDEACRRADELNEVMEVMES